MSILQKPTAAPNAFELCIDQHQFRSAGSARVSRSSSSISATQSPPGDEYLPTLVPAEKRIGFGTRRPKHSAQAVQQLLADRRFPAGASETVPGNFRCGLILLVRFARLPSSLT